MARRRRRRGIILITTLFFMVLFFMLAFGIYTMSPRNDDRTATRDRTITEAHFACGAGIRHVKEWVAAVTKPPNGLNQIDDLGETWAIGSALTVGTTTIQRTHNDVFSVPAGAHGDGNYAIRALSGLSCPKGRFAGKTGVDFLGFRPDANLTSADYAALKADEANWPVFVPADGNALVVGEYEVYTYLVPSPKAIASAKGVSGDGLKSFLAVSIAYRSGLPILRARCLLKEVSASKYAYRANTADTVNGERVKWVVTDGNSVLFDGPVHTNDTPIIAVPSSYWNAALEYFPSDLVPGPDYKKHPKRAFMNGSLTFSASNATFANSLTPNFDGVAWAGSNYLGSDANRRPYGAGGVTMAAAPAGPDAFDGPVNDRYKRLIEGGRESIRKIPTVPLPADLTILKNAAWGSDTVTGLDTTNANPALWTVDSTQKNGSVQVTTVTRPAYRQSNGATVNAVTRVNNPDNGIFINPESGTMKAAGGIAVKGDTKNMFLEVTDSNGNRVTSGLDSTALADANGSYSTAGNPTLRVQSTIDSYDSNSGSPITTYTANGSSTGTWNPTQNAVYHPTQNGTFQATQNGVYHATVNGVWHATVAGTWHATVNGVHHEPTGSGSGTGYWDPTQNGYWGPATQNGYWNPNTANAYWDATVPAGTVGYQAAYTTPTQNGYTSGGGVTQYTAAGTIMDPFKYKAQDWVTDVKNIPITIPTVMPLPTGAQADAWKKGVGGELATGDPNGISTHQADLMGNTPGAANTKGITSVYLHTTSGDTAGSLLSSPFPVPTGKIVVYKQSRSDANRLDVFVLDNPKVASIPTAPGTPVSQKNPPGLNGAVYGTGDINGLRGVNMEARSIGVDYSTNKGIGIVDNVLQYGVVKGEKPHNAYHGLGLVGTKMNVQTDETQYSNKSLYLYATIIAGKSGNTGGLDVSRSNGNLTTDWNRVASTTDTNATLRTIQIFGGLTEQVTKARLVGTAGGSKGWNQQMNFDKHLSYQPPPFFPTTNQLAPLSYFQEVVIGQ